VFKMAFNGKKWREVSNKIPLYWKLGKSSISVLFMKYYNKRHRVGKDRTSILDGRKKENNCILKIDTPLSQCRLHLVEPVG
jgi:hypothetical protein